MSPNSTEKEYSIALRAMIFLESIGVLFFYIFISPQQQKNLKIK